MEEESETSFRGMRINESKIEGTIWEESLGFQTCFNVSLLASCVMRFPNIFATYQPLHGQNPLLGRTQRLPPRLFSARLMLPCNLQYFRTDLHSYLHCLGRHSRWRSLNLTFLCHYRSSLFSGTSNIFAAAVVFLTQRQRIGAIRFPQPSHTDEITGD